MREHQVLRARAFCHRAQIGGAGLAIKKRPRHLAVLVTHNRMNGGVHNDVGPQCQRLYLIGCRGSARRRKRIVARIPADNYAAGRRVHAIGGMTDNVG